MTPERLYRLIEAYCSNSLTSDECEELYEYLESKRNTVSDANDNTLTSNPDIPVLDIARSEKILEKIKKDPRFIAANDNSTSEPIVKINRSWRWLSAAASVLIISSLSLWFLTGKKDQPLANIAAPKTLTSAILPGKKKAVISMSSNMADSYTTVATPKAAEYHLTLPDGSKVWLNSSSSVRYATAFSGKLRKVYLTGEAYFEVAKNKKRPFHVETNGVTIKVLGTHFNVTSYKPGLVQTSLLEGSVIVEAKNKQAKLKPGQQVVASNQHLLEVSAADTEEAIAWKNGFFKFQDEDIKSIMEKVAMWYDIEVEFQDNTDSQKFCGVFSKSKSLSELLSSFEAVGNLRFKTEGRRVTVMK